MYGTLSLVIGAAVAIHYLLQLRIWLDLDKHFIYNHAPGPCYQALEDGGAEDVNHIGDGIFLATSGFSLTGSKGPGTLKILNVNSREPVMHTLNITNAPPKSDFLTAPHGMSTWKDPNTGEITLYVVTHPLDGDRLEVFDVRRTGRMYYLQYVKTITDPSFKYMNNLVMVAKDKFYITKFLEYRDELKIHIDLAMSNWGEVYYYDGRKARKVAEGLHLCNGINISPDGSTIYVAEFGGKNLIAYRREPNNNLVHQWTHFMDSGVDNIEIDPRNGDLWIGSHPIHYKVLDLFHIFHFLLPSQVLQVKLVDGMVSEVIEVYADDGNEVAGSTVAAYYNGRLIIGTISRQAIVCDVKYSQ